MGKNYRESLSEQLLNPAFKREWDALKANDGDAGVMVEEGLSGNEGLARAIAVEAHRGQFDKGGRPYIEHPAHVASQVTGDVCKAAAWLHDVVEDTETTIQDLSVLGVSKEVLDAVRDLTHDKGEPYFDYLQRVKANPVARQVKLADLAHNSDLTRLREVTDADLRRVAKYKDAIEFLTT